MKLFLVGGFLGSGKTTAIRQAAACLHDKGKKTGVVTNDQGAQLVDTQFLQQEGVAVEEVTGGCFCCNYRELDERIRALRQKEKPDVIFAESVGSCTDLVATIINPLLHFNKGALDIVLSVFADVRLLYAYLLEDRKLFHKNVNYIYEKQLEEADIIVVNKTDLPDEDQLSRAKSLIEKTYAGKKIVYQHSMTREGIQAWMTALFDTEQYRGARQSLQLDYDQYGAGEAELAWLDEELTIDTKGDNAFQAANELISNIHAKIRQQEYPIGHLKFIVDDGRQKRKISFTSGGRDEWKQAPGNHKTDTVTVLVNARVQTQPVLLKELVGKAVNELELSTGCRVTAGRSAAFQPGYPKPTHRIQS